MAHRPQGEKEPEDIPQYVATTFAAQPQAHGIIRRSPSTLADLRGNPRRRRNRSGRFTPPSLSRLGPVPRARREAGADRRVAIDSAGTMAKTETWDYFDLLTPKTIREVGVAIGLWGNLDGNVGVLLNTRQ